MLLTYAGRLPDSQDFPSENVDYVDEQIKLLIASLCPRIAVGSAAAGADLLVLTAALQAGSHAKVILAGTSGEFRESSVAGRGARWERLYDALSDHEHVEIIEIPRKQEDRSSYRAVTAAISDLAARLAEGDPIMGLTIAKARDGQDHSAELAAAQDLHHRLVLRVDPTRRREQTPVAFVAMPYGRRTNLPTGGEYEADATYRRILLPALIDGGYQPIRADADSLLEIIDLTMLRAIHGSELLIADLATLNANVMWELGVRHAWRRAGTILLRPAGTSTPFDVSHARVHEYNRNPTEVSDHDAIDGIRLLRGLVEAAGEGHTDSPVFATFPDLPEPTLPDPDPHAAGAAAAAARHSQEVSSAADLREADKLQGLVQGISSDEQLDVDARRALLEHVGFALIACGEHTAAAEVLAPLAGADTAMERTRLQQQYAHALIRSQDPKGRAQRLERAELRLQALLTRQPPTGEAYGLLASAAKARVEDTLDVGGPPGEQLSVAIEAYLQGFRLDPADYYPGVVALALLRLRGEHLRPSEQDLDEARELLPVVRFAATRSGEPDSSDVWRLATIAEVALHDFLLNANEEQLRIAEERYSRVAIVAGPQQRASVARQLRLLLNAGDPPGVINPILAHFATRPAS
jgi:hypothetical protein